MCGIWFYMCKKGYKSTTLDNGKLYNSFMSSLPRGPEKSSFLKLSEYGVYIGFHRLSIMDPSTKGDQPFVVETDDKIIYTICNGEIYYFKELCEKYDIHPSSGSDCEVLAHLYLKIGIEALVKEIIAEYAFVICEIQKSSGDVTVYTSRDHCGIRPLFITGNENEVVLSSQLSGSPFLDKNYEIKQFPPRTFLRINNTDEKMYDSSAKYIEYINFGEIKTTITDLEKAKKLIRETLKEAVECRMMSDRPVACLLSGGLDSSLVVDLVSDYCKRHEQELYTFSIGLEGGTDEYYAKKVSEAVGSIHVHITVTEDELIETYNMIHKISETYDITTNRAIVLQYLVSKYVREYKDKEKDKDKDKEKWKDIKVLLIGDGSDELFGGYLYFHKAPTPEKYHNEIVRLLDNIHVHDVLRADRGIASNGLEGRDPFLDKRLIQLVLSIKPEYRMVTGGVEKWLLRESFKNNTKLPNEVLYRKKEAFSDGVSSVKRSWYSIIQENVNSIYSDEEFKELSSKYTHCQPISKESLYLRKQFEKEYGDGDETAKVVPFIWMPLKEWVGDVGDPSARKLTVYSSSEVV